MFPETTYFTRCVVHSQFNLDYYIENSELHVSRFVLKGVLRFFSQFTWKQLVFIKEVEVFV